MREMGEVKESVEIGKRMCCSQDLGEMYHVSGSRCTHHPTNQRRRFFGWVGAEGGVDHFLA